MPAIPKYSAKPIVLTSQIHGFGQIKNNGLALRSRISWLPPPPSPKRNAKPMVLISPNRWFGWVKTIGLALCSCTLGIRGYANQEASKGEHPRHYSEEMPEALQITRHQRGKHPQQYKEERQRAYRSETMGRWASEIKWFWIRYYNCF